MMRHPKADKDGLYLPRSEGGRSLIRTEQSYKTTRMGLHKYLQTAKGWMMKLVRKHENNKNFAQLQRKSKVYERVKH